MLNSENVRRINLRNRTVFLIQVNGVWYFDHLSPGILLRKNGTMRSLIQRTLSRLPEDATIKICYEDLISMGLTAYSNGRIFVRLEKLRRFRLIMSVLDIKSQELRERALLLDLLSELMVSARDSLEVKMNNNGSYTKELDRIDSKELMGTEKIRYSNGVLLEQDVYELVSKTIIVGNVRFMHDPYSNLCTVYSTNTGGVRRLGSFSCKDINLDTCKTYIEENIEVNMNVQLADGR